MLRSGIFAFSLIFTLIVSTSCEASNSVSRIIVFGDSLSDGGTYAQTAGPKGGGKFTTNPGKIWVELIAEKLNLPLKVNRLEGFSQPLQVLGGFNYAQGGSRVMEKSTDQNLTARPLNEQLGYFLSQYKHFSSTDLILVEGGANDILAQLAMVRANQETPAEALKHVKAAAENLSMLLAAMKASGATKIVLLNLPAIETTPYGLAQTPENQRGLSKMREVFNQTLASKLSGAGSVVKQIDFYLFDQNFNSNFQKYGFTTVTQPACRLDIVPNKSSLFCSAQTLVAPGADLTFKYADGLHPTTAYSRVVAEFVYSQLGFSKIR